MRSKRDKQLKAKLKQRAKLNQAAYESETAAVYSDPARANFLNEQLRRAEESGDMVKQNLIAQELARLEIGV